jgi:general secretion pathway protein L
MNVLRPIFAWLSRWLDDVAFAFSGLREVVWRGRKIRLVEQPDGAFLVRPVGKRPRSWPVSAPLRIEDEDFIGPGAAKIRMQLAGGQIEIVLKPSRFVFRPLELPRRASDFLDGVVRAQIDRLTPWDQRDAAFGWSAPLLLGADRMVVTVAAIAASSIAPVVQALARNRSDSILVSTIDERPGADSAPIIVFSRRSGAELRVRRVRQRLVGLLVLASFGVGLSAGAAVVFGSDLDAKRLDLERRLAERHAALISGRSSVAEEALAALEARKRATAAGVMVLEALSQTLPDDTYLNELHIEDGRVQIAGLTHDAPALIKLIEQSGHFTRAMFSAPTTRAPTENGERFHIEAHIEPVFATLK